MENVKSFFRKNILLTVSTLVLLLVGLPTVLFLSQKQQETRSRASASTTMYFVPHSTSSVPLQKNVGDTVSFDVMLNPGTNLVSFIKLELQFDPSKWQTSGPSTFTVNASAFPSILEGPTVSSGSIVTTINVGPDPTKAINANTKVGTITLTAIAPTASGSTNISFGNGSKVLSIREKDLAGENVLSTAIPAYVAISGTGSLTPTPPPIRTPTPISQPSISATPSVLNITVAAPNVDNKVLSGTFALSAGVSGGIPPYKVSFVRSGTYPIKLGDAYPTGYGWIVNWNTTPVPNGEYSIYAMVTDASGAVKFSAPRSVVVQNATVPTPTLRPRQ